MDAPAVYNKQVLEHKGAGQPKLSTEQALLCRKAGAKKVAELTNQVSAKYNQLVKENLIMAQRLLSKQETRKYVRVIEFNGKKMAVAPIHFVQVQGKIKATAGERISAPKSDLSKSVEICLMASPMASLITSIDPTRQVLWKQIGAFCNK